MNPVKQFKKLLLAAALAGASAVFFTTNASADLAQCSSVEGSVRVYDFGGNQCGRLEANNPDWRYIGTPAWNDRMDQFGNDDWSRGRNMCLYRYTQFVRYDTPPRIVRVAQWLDWGNTVSSNQWTRATTCPTTD